MTDKIYAAIDLGSNSFRMEKAKIYAGRYYKIRYIKKGVRLGGGLDKDSKLTNEIIEKGYECLRSFAQVIGGLPADSIIAVGTQTLREATNKEVFIKEAENILRAPIQIISGKEEAKLIYIGASMFLNNPYEKRLIIDIGGRSSEIIIGVGAKPTIYESVSIGSVKLSQIFFQDGVYTEEIFNQAIDFASENLQKCIATMNINIHDYWLNDLNVYGTSGTIAAVIKILELNKLEKSSISWASLQWLYQKMINAKNINKLKIKGLPKERKPVIGGGIAIIKALFKTLHIQKIYRANGGLRHGLLQQIIK